jgi:RNase adaptor protein for sRNA GlmZ degradation
VVGLTWKLLVAPALVLAIVWLWRGQLGLTEKVTARLMIRTWAMRCDLTHAQLAEAIDGVLREREVTSALKRWADLVIDTTELKASDLRRRIAEQLGSGGGHPLTVTIQSFGFAHGLPRSADLVFDMRFLANPHWDIALRPLTGEDPAVAAYVAADPGFAPAIDRIAKGEALDEVVVTNTIPLSAQAIGCSKIRQLSVAPLIAETINRIAHGESVMSLFSDQS